MSIYVNVIDLVGSYATSKPAQTFPSEPALSTYTMKTGKCIPNGMVRTSLLQFLLRRAFRPWFGARAERGPPPPQPPDRITSGGYNLGHEWVWPSR